MRLSFIGIEDVPMIEPGDDLAQIISDAVLAMGEALQADDVIVIAQKVISKAENRYLDLRSVTPSADAVALGLEVDKDPLEEIKKSAVATAQVQNMVAGLNPLLDDFEIRSHAPTSRATRSM